MRRARHPRVSRCPASTRLSRLGTAWVIEDLESKNGLWVGNKRVARHQLADGDAL
jgi:pSer/pThr/pTyr-binding forkhead associated (FHA) protein